MNDDSLIEAALVVIARRPLPMDAQEQLEAIGKKLVTQEGKRQMGDIWEGFMAAGGVLKHPGQ